MRQREVTHSCQLCWSAIMKFLVLVALVAVASASVRMFLCYISFFHSIFFSFFVCSFHFIFLFYFLSFDTSFISYFFLAFFQLILLSFHISFFHLIFFSFFHLRFFFFHSIFMSFFHSIFLSFFLTSFIQILHFPLHKPVYITFRFRLDLKRVVSPILFSFLFCSYSYSGVCSDIQRGKTSNGDY